MSDVATTAEPTTAPEPHTDPQPGEHTAPPPMQHVERVDLLEMQLAAVQELAALRLTTLLEVQLGGARKDLAQQRAAGEATRQAIAQKYGLQQGDQIAPDGTIWRAGGHG